MADSYGSINPDIQQTAEHPKCDTVRLVLFDIDGTLVSTGGAGMKAFGEAFEAAFGVGDVTGKIKFAGRTDYSLFREMCRYGGVDCNSETRESFFTHYLRLVDSHLKENTGGPFPGVVRMLDESELPSGWAKRAAARRACRSKKPLPSSPQRHRPVTRKLHHATVGNFWSVFACSYRTSGPNARYAHHLRQTVAFLTPRCLSD